MNFANVERAVLAGLSVVVALGWSGASQAANLCSSPPTFVPGLNGPPAWTGAGQLRPDLNEPRWAASPLTGFAHGGGDPLDGAFRLVTNAAGTRLYLSIQTSNDLNLPATQDKVFLGISKDVGGMNNIAQGVVISVKPSAPAGTFIVPDNFDSYSFDGTAWTKTTAATPPTWVEAPGSWSNNPGGGVDWGINFIVNLTTLGIAPTDTYKLAVGMIIRDEGTGNDSYLYSPGVAFPGGSVTLFGPSGNLLSTPSAWAQADAAGSGCVTGISLTSAQIFTNNPATNKIATNVDHVNVFNAEPDFGVVPVGANKLTGEFRIAMWGTIADPNAGWQPIPSAIGLLNDGAGHIQFTCPPNTASSICGMTMPAEEHQCVQVRLNHATGYSHANAPIRTASAYRNMNFLPLSKDERVATVSLAGLPPTASGKRDVYLYVEPRNLPQHGQDEIYLRTDAMAATQRAFLAPKPVGERIDDPKKASAYLAAYRRRQVEDARRREQESPGAGQAAPSLKELPSLRTDEQALQEAWPSYEVRPYYDSGTTSAEGKEAYRSLVAMPKFLMYFSHEAKPLYGFSHQLQLASGGDFEELRAPTDAVAGVYRLRMAATGSATLKTTVEAHEAPLKPVGTGATCPPCSETHGHPPEGHQHPPGTEVPPHHHCACSTPGYFGGRQTPWAAIALLAGLWLLRRRSRRVA